MGSATYRAGAFLQAARGLGLQVIAGVDLPPDLAPPRPDRLALSFGQPDAAVAALVDYARANPVGALLAVDDGATLIAARAAAALGLPHNALDAAYAARDKYVMRGRLAAGGAPIPAYRLYSTADDPDLLAREAPYPCVVKPTLLSGSQGVIRADNPAEFVAAFRRAAAIVRSASGQPEGALLVEHYIPGDEVVLEGLLAAGQLTVLALFDKPDPLVGPFFEETIYVTPSRLPAAVQQQIAVAAAQACAALGLREGPIHAELRVNERGPWIVEVAGRSIGGHCSRTLRFGAADASLEELIVRRAMGLPAPTWHQEGADGVMMIPIPRGGILKRVDGVEAARAVPLIQDVQITAPCNHPLTPLPEGSSYLGFIFARGDTPAQVEAALRAAHSHLRVVTLPRLPVLSRPPVAAH